MRPDLIGAVYFVGRTLTDSLDDPSFWEIRAAVKAESLAIAAATRLGWNMEPLERRESLYSAQQSWSGNLLEF